MCRSQKLGRTTRMHVESSFVLRKTSSSSNSSYREVQDTNRLMISDISIIIHHNRLSARRCALLPMSNTISAIRRDQLKLVHPFHLAENSCHRLSLLSWLLTCESRGCSYNSSIEVFVLQTTATHPVWPGFPTRILHSQLELLLALI